MLGWLKRKLAPPPTSEGHTGTIRDLLVDPVLLAAWVETYMILRPRWQDAFDLLPDEGTQRNLEITFAQKERFAKEYTVLRIVGVLIAVRKHIGNYETTLNDLTGRLAFALTLPREELGQALDDYVRFMIAGETQKVETLYMRRVYDDSDHYTRMKIAGVASFAPKSILESFEIFRNAVNGKL